MKFWKNLAFAPKHLKNACETEHWSHKAKIVCFAWLMCSIATYYQYYFNMLVFRSGQYQMAALAGEAGFTFNEASRDYKWTEQYWTDSQTLDAWNNKSLKQLKQVQMDWKTGSYKDAGNNVWVSPNGNPKDNKGFYTQKKKFYNSYKNFANDKWDKLFADNPIQRDSKTYNDWAEMHKDILWFDTAACWKHSYIGQANKVTITPDTTFNTQYDSDPTKTYQTVTAAATANPSLDATNFEGNTFGTFWAGWYAGAQYSNQAPNNDYNGDAAYNKLIDPKDSSGPYQRNWEQVSVSSGGQTV